MFDLSVSLFGKLQIYRDGARLASVPPKKARALFAYLLIHRRAHPREKLATLLWHGDTSRTKAYLRKALWQLRQSVEPDDEGSVVQTDGDWVQIHPALDPWVDIAVFEGAFSEARDCAVSEMAPAQVRELKRAADLYTGDLLESWYQDWCLQERERLRDIFLRMLDQLARCCEQQGNYDTGIEYGLRSLRIDPARERTHRQLMRLRARVGDRTGALRQYERCAEVLDRELGVRPATATQRLHEQILNDTFPFSSDDSIYTESPTASVAGAPRPEARRLERDRAFPAGAAEVDSLRDGLDRIRELQRTLATAQRQIRHDIEAVEIALQQRK